MHLHDPGIHKVEGLYSYADEYLRYLRSEQAEQLNVFVIPAEGNQM